MRTTRARALPALALALAVGVGACASRTPSMRGGDLDQDPTYPPPPSSMGAMRTANQMVAAWPQKQREVAGRMMAKYGQPATSSDQMLVWTNAGPYARITLLREEVPHEFPMPHVDFMTHTVKYKVPTEMMDELVAYDGSVWFHRTRGELSAQCDTEEHNNLALNLAHEVATGRRTVQDARMMYGKVVMELKNGGTSPYASSLMFQPNMSAADAGMKVNMPGM